MSVFSHTDSEIPCPTLLNAPVKRSMSGYEFYSKTSWDQTQKGFYLFALDQSSEKNFGKPWRVPLWEARQFKNDFWEDLISFAFPDGRHNNRKQQKKKNLHFLRAVTTKVQAAEVWCDANLIKQFLRFFTRTEKRKTEDLKLNKQGPFPSSSRYSYEKTLVRKFWMSDKVWAASLVMNRQTKPETLINMKFLGDDGASSCWTA